VHDIVNLEGLGIPGVMVASDQFVAAADVQARALGADPARVFVPHPIQDRTDDELRALADHVYEQVLDTLVASGAPRTAG
jgi:alkanesulfonate monooxygenase SsuD/methylene tetrahydromethanopterin reductase-like flavin-dependent oxidoreductase (luciferase family)